MSLAFLCPGQGAQTPGFLHRLPSHSQVSETLAEAGDILKLDVLDLDSETALQSTVAVQLSLVTAAVAVARALAAEGVEPDAVAGLSIGAFSAAVIARAISFPDTLGLVRRRATLMSEAYPQGYGLAAIVGLGELRLRTIVADVTRAEDPVCIANLNGPAEFVLSGSLDALDRAIGAARQAGARRAHLLPVSVPSHSPLLAGVADTLVREIAQVPVHPPAINFVGNRRARVLWNADAVREELATNVSHPVRWHDATRLLHELGAQKFLELPPGNTLAHLAQETGAGVQAWSATDMPFRSALLAARR